MRRGELYATPAMVRPQYSGTLSPSLTMSSYCLHGTPPPYHSTKRFISTQLITQLTRPSSHCGALRKKRTHHIDSQTATWSCEVGMCNHT